LKIEVLLPKQKNNVWVSIEHKAALTPCTVDLHEIYCNVVAIYVFVSCNMFWKWIALSVLEYGLKKLARVSSKESHLNGPILFNWRNQSEFVYPFQLLPVLFAMPWLPVCFKCAIAILSGH